MQRIAPHLWFDKEAREAAELYVSIFHGKGRPAGKGSSVKSAAKLENTPSGTVEIVSFDLFGQEFAAISAGPYFKFTPAISFIVALSGSEEVDAIWNDLSQGGTPLMELGDYPFSERYGWLQDRFGVSWQLMSMAGGDVGQRIIPMLMFTGEQYGKAEEAVRSYVAVFSGGDDRKSGTGDGARGDREAAGEGTTKPIWFTLAGQEFAALDSAHPHDFTFNEAVSLMVRCDSQEEIDHYWTKLSANPTAEQCGWLKDRYGVSWQIVPTVLDQMLRDADKQKVARVTSAFLAMKKFDLQALRRAYEGR
jgi:predicted 3-demethylubiquinone-9 3-methyltransferase (glyoxalase superfamily)